MTAAKIIRAIKSLPPEEQAKVVRFAYRLDARRKLSGGEISALAQRMADTTDPADVALMRAAIVEGFRDATPARRRLLADIGREMDVGKKYTQTQVDAKLARRPSRR